METPTMVLFLLNVHKIPKKLQLEVSNHSEHTPIGYVQKTDPKPKN